MMSDRFVYLDNNATTRVAPEVLRAMLPYLEEQWGNPSSAYTFGHRLVEPVEEARQQVADLMRAEAREVVFTSGGTESNNAVLHSALVTQRPKRHVVTTAVEHSATLKYCSFLEKQGYQVTYLPVDDEGRLEAGAVEQAIRQDTAIVSVIWANNETGVILPVREIAAVCRSRGVLFHSDAVQAVGKLSINVSELGVDFLSLSAHKLYAPKGIGALYMRRQTKFQPYLLGGSQERGRRAGTENVAGIIAFGRAAELAGQDFVGRNERVGLLRDRLERGILEAVPGVVRNGCETPRLPNTSNLAFEGVEAEGVLMLLDQAGVCASSGSACTTGSLDPSHVLTAMGCSAARARSSVRFSLGAYTTQAEVDYVLERLPGIVETLRSVAV